MSTKVTHCKSQWKNFKFFLFLSSSGITVSTAVAPLDITLTISTMLGYNYADIFYSVEYHSIAVLLLQLHCTFTANVCSAK